MCTCGIPSKANFHLGVVWIDPDDGQTGSTDVYLCDEHTPNVPEGEHDAESDPFFFTPDLEDVLGLVNPRARIRQTLMWDGDDAAEIEGYTLTQLR